MSPSLGEGGAQRVTSTLLENLDRTRLAIELCLFKSRVDFALPAEIRVTTLLSADHSLGRRPWLLPGALLRLRSTIGRRRPDVVFSVIDQANLLVGAALAGDAGPRWIARAGANPVSQSRLQRLLTAAALRRADALIGNSEALARDLRTRYPNAAGRIRSLANPVDFDRLDARAAEPGEPPAGPPSPRLLWIGRMVPEKRPDVLVDAAAALKRRRPFHLWMCGAGPLAADVAARVRARGLENEISLLGFCENPYALCARADVFVLTSEVEGLPNALIEAQGLGLPAVSTDCPFGPSEILAAGETGLLTPINDPEAIAGALDELLGDPERRAEMGRAARRRARERYGVSALIGRWQQVLEGVS